MLNPVLLKPALGFAVGLCTSHTVGRIIQANLTNVTMTQKVTSVVAAAALGSCAANVANAQFQRDYDQVAEAIHLIKEAQKEQN